MPDYETLIEQLVKLHTYAAVPSVLLIDDLDNYFNDESIKNDSFMHIARTCALISHSMNSCSRILKMNVSEELYALYILFYNMIFLSIIETFSKHYFKYFFKVIFTHYKKNLYNIIRNIKALPFRHY